MSVFDVFSRYALQKAAQIDGEIREREKKIRLIHQERNKAIDEGPDFEKLKVLHLEICHLEAKKRRQINSSRIRSRTHSAYIAGANKGTGKEMGDE